MHRYKRKVMWLAKGGKGHWCSSDYEELLKRDRLNLDIFWLKDKTLKDLENPPEPDVLAQEIIDDLENALEQLRSVAVELKAEA